jgi:SnoaL-like domain
VLTILTLSGALCALKDNVPSHLKREDEMPAAKKQIAKSTKKLNAPKAAATKAVASKTKKKSNIAFLKLARPSMMSQLSAGAGEKLPVRVQAMVDKSEISHVLASFARGLDRVDENLLRSVLHPDATLDFGPGIFQGTGNDYVHWVLGVLHGVKSSHHVLAQSRIELSGDAAQAETYFTTHFRIEKSIGREDVFVGGRYLDRMERRPSGPGGLWKIMHRKQVIDWVRTEAVSDIFYHQNPDALWSNRSKTDPSHTMAQFPGSQSGGKLPAFLGRRYESKSMKF